MRKIIGSMFIIYFLIISIFCISGLINNFLASKMIWIIILAAIFMLVLGFVFFFRTDVDIKLGKNHILLFIPFLMIALASDGELSEQLASNRASNLSTKIDDVSISDDVINNSSDSLVDYNVVDDSYVDLVNYLNNKPEEVEGKTIRIRGYVVTDADYLTTDTFAIGKYNRSCCTADAGFLGMLVFLDDLEVVKNSWYEIEGVLEVVESAYGYETISIRITNIEAIDAENRYV